MENGFRLGRCSDCSLLYIDPMPEAGARMTEIEKGHFATNEKVLDAGRQLASEGATHNRFAAYVEVAARHAPKGKWLDVGCGSGTLMTIAAERGYETEGIELTADRRKAAERVTRSIVYGQTIEDVNFDDDSFDVISMINVFSHLTGPAATLCEIARILKPGGVLLLVTAEFGNGVRKHHLYRWSLGDHLFFLGSGTMSRYAARAGLDVREEYRVWIPDALYSRERFRVHGRSAWRNVAKVATLSIPGAFPILRCLMLRRQRDNPGYSSMFVIRRAASSGAMSGS